MCFTIWGVTITITRSASSSRSLEWYPGMEKQRLEEQLEQVRQKGIRLSNFSRY
jgi:hypothetical protein